MSVIVDRDKDQDGFFWVEQLTANGKIPQSDPPGHDRIEGYWGHWNLTCEAQTDLYLGSGEVEEEDGEMAFQFMRRAGKITIPGSSWKGVVRNLTELFTPACFTGENSKCQCPVCNLFGRMGHQGRICIEDSTLDNPMLKWIQIDQRTTPTAKKPRGETEEKFRKLYCRDYKVSQAALRTEQERIEVVEKGATFDFRLRFQNLKEWEMGLLLLSLGVGPGLEFDFKCGGAKNRGLGLVRLRWQEGFHTEGISWFSGKRGDPLTLSSRQNALDGFKEQAKSLWPSINEIVAYLRKEYGHDNPTV